MPVPALSPFEGMDIRTLIDAQAALAGHRTFLVWEPLEGAERSWTYLNFQNAVRRFAAGLQARQVKPGDKVIVHLENCPEAVIAWLGCAYAGAVAVTTNARSTAEELAYFMAHSQAVGCVTQPRLAKRVAQAGSNLAWQVVTDTDNGEAAEACDETFERFDAIDADPATLSSRPYNPSVPFGIQYTSGTTARPKAVLWTHANALWGASVSALHEALGSDDVHLTFLPLFHTNAQVYSVLASLWAGAKVVLLPRFSASRFWPLSLKHRATWTSMVPFCLKALAALPVPERHCYRLWGNAVCSPPTDHHFRAKTIGWWGMTETVTHGVVGSTRLPNAPMSLGRPSPGYKIHVLDQAGQPVRPGQIGDLLVEGQRGVSLFAEYAGDPDATARAFTPEGLFITGDRVRLGEDGFLYFADRSKDVLKVGGENVSASEIERVISNVPGVSEVAVVGCPHPMLDEVPVAFVIPLDAAGNDLEDRIYAACKQALADFKRPSAVRFVTDFPRATLEKVAKEKLRQILLQDNYTKCNAGQ